MNPSVNGLLFEFDSMRISKISGFLHMIQKTYLATYRLIPLVILNSGRAVILSKMLLQRWHAIHECRESKNVTDYDTFSSDNQICHVKTSSTFLNLETV